MEGSGQNNNDYNPYSGYNDESYGYNYENSGGGGGGGYNNYEAYGEEDYTNYNGGVSEPAKKGHDPWSDPSPVDDYQPDDTVDVSNRMQSEFPPDGS